jgi:hypothetical protein
MATSMASRSSVRASRTRAAAPARGGMVWIHAPSAHSNTVASYVLGMPARSIGDGLCARDQCIIIGTSAPWARLVWAGPAVPPRSRENSRAAMPIAASHAAPHVPRGKRR